MWRSRPDITSRIVASLIGWVMILVTMNVETFKTGLTVFIGNATIYLTSYWPILSVLVSWYVRRRWKCLSLKSKKNKFRLQLYLHASYLDRHLEINSENWLRTQLYDKRDDFNFPIVNFPFICSNIPSASAYAVYISQLIRYSSDCGSYQDFLERGLLLTRKLLNKVITRVSFLVRQAVCNTTGHTTTSLFNGDARTTRICRKPIFRSSHAFYTRNSTQLYKKSFNYQNDMKKKPTMKWMPSIREVGPYNI